MTEENVPRDHLKRYLLRPPTGGERQPYTRVTTVAGALDDRRALEAWLKRGAALGMVVRPDLYALVAASGATIDDKIIDEWIEAGCDSAGSNRRANLGTALHRFCERMDTSATPEQVFDTIPEDYKADVAAYMEATQGFKWMIVEEVVTLEDLKIAGMPDRIGYTPDGTLVVADIKTGKGSDKHEGELIYGWLAFGIQCALYAHASHIYDVVDDSRLPMPHEVSKSQALVIHLPALEGKCRIYDVDLTRGWADAELAMEVRARRARQRSIGTPRLDQVQKVALSQFLAKQYEDERAAGIVAPEASERPLRAEGSFVLASRATGLEPDETRMADPVALGLLEEHYLALSGELRGWITGIVKSSLLHDIPPSRLHLKDHGSIKRFEILRGLVKLAEAQMPDDQMVKAAVGVIDPVLVVSGISLGAALAVLTTDEAIAFSGLVDNLIDRANEQRKDSND